MSLSDTERIKQKIDIIDLIGEYLQLKSAGTYHKGLCPFHNEKTPSFTVNKEKQFFHCFGCSKNGDIFNFIQEIEGMDFPEALRFLAQKAGVTLEQRAQSQVNQNQKNRLKDINQKTAFFYHNVLTQLEVSKDAREYLNNRGVSAETIKEWNIGFVPDQWELLTKYLLKKGHGIDDLVVSGLTIKKEGATNGQGYYDRFRGRIMFPIQNAFGDVVGFTGRVLVEHEKSGGKYVNTPQTPVYDKSNVLFGLDKAKKAIKQVGHAVIVEGQMDVIACHQVGMTHVVASSGTALTEAQLHLLSRYTKEIRMAFDTDAAGMTAAKRGADIALTLGFQVKIIQIPKDCGKDPDECIKKDITVWQQSVDTAQDVMKWYFEKAFLGKDISDPREKQKISDILLQEIIKIPFEVEKDHWIKHLSARLMTDVDVLKKDIIRIVKEKTFKTPKQHQEREEVKQPVKKDHITLLLEKIANQLVSLLVLEPSIIKDIWATLPHDALSTLDEVKEVYEYIKSRYSIGELNDMFADVSDTSLLSEVNVFLLRGKRNFSELTAPQKKLEAIKLSDLLSKRYIDNKRKKLQTEMERAKAEGNEQKEAQLFEEFIKLTT